MLDSAVSAAQDKRLGAALVSSPYDLAVAAGRPLANASAIRLSMLQTQLIAHGSGVGFVARCNVSALPKNRIALMPVNGKPLLLNLSIGFKRDKHLSKDGLLFSRFVKEWFKV